MATQPEPASRYDVFLSHNGTDKALVEELARRLEDEAGLKSFLDKWHLVPGEPWQEALEEALEQSATCAVFLGATGLGPWENEELRAALDKRVRNNSFRVIPVLLPGANPKDPATLPRFLRRLTWIDFRSGLDDAEAFRYLLAGIRGQAPGRGRRGTGLEDSAKRGLKEALQRSRPILLLTLPSFAMALLALVLVNWRVATHVQAELTVSRAVFRVGGSASTPILNSVNFQSITVEKFAGIRFSPETMQVADPAQYLEGDGSYPESSWKSLQTQGQVVIAGLDETLQPAVTAESMKVASDTAGSLDRVWARPGSEVTLETSEGRPAHITLKVERQESSASLSFREPFQLIVTHGTVSGLPEPLYRSDSLAYRVQLPAHRPEIEITSQPRALVCTITLSAENAARLFSGTNLPVVALDFTRQDAAGNPVTALTQSGEIQYPGLPGVGKISLTTRDTVGLDRLEKFHIEEIGLAAEHSGIRVRLNGIAGRITAGPPDFPKDLRLTCAEMLRASRQWILLVALAWMIPTTLGAYSLRRAFRGRPP